jgi:hypothetical protein
MKAQERADAERLLARIRCMLIRTRLLAASIEEVGVSLRHRMISPVSALNWLADLAVDADTVAAALAEGEEILPEGGSTAPPSPSQREGVVFTTSSLAEAS